MSFQARQYTVSGNGFIKHKKDNRFWHRVQVELPLVYLNEAKEENPGVVIDISPGGFCFETKTPPALDEKIICYIKEVGRIGGIVVRKQGDRVAVLSDLPSTKREKLASLLTWITNKDKLGLTSERRAPRTAGTGGVNVETEDGASLRCKVTDMSVVGAALTTRDTRPLIGQPVKVGSQRGRVARYFDSDGFAVDFTS